VDREKIMAFLEAHHASTAGHSGRTFLRHLEGTERILRDWGCPQHLQLAGLFHSIYGTNIFTVQSASFGEREVISSLIGPIGEWLAYLFCVTARPDAFFIAKTSKSMRHRYTQMPIAVRDDDLRDLFLLEAANHIEQNMNPPLVKRIHDLYQDDPTVTDAAKYGMWEFFS
jgi:hypothetical protein